MHTYWATSGGASISLQLREIILPAEQLPIEIPKIYRNLRILNLSNLGLEIHDTKGILICE